MRARIYRPARAATQSGSARSRVWVLDFPAAAAREIDPLMGWTSSDDTQAQVRLTFRTKDEALAYAKDNGIEAVVIEPKNRAANIRTQGYGENFATGRRGAWTH
ncbi:ETC complex I subunit [Wenxinia saemankumensis]|uniref:ETC complex I subunit conserved region n=1 Tax=Wenxinia saemankumensis TaxID=1447782 RepID=A0A1M6HRM6_9RHOB|nr:ETC complex I subunit [Wenxinia saemankumensis]SHJ24835.1 ETC complex I subunit conserved region [Wenxinia saemankumensis]